MKTNEIFNEVRMAYMGQPLTGSEVKTLLSELPYGKTDLFALLIIIKQMISKDEFKLLINEINYELAILEGKLKTIKMTGIDFWAIILFALIFAAGMIWGR